MQFFSLSGMHGFFCPFVYVVLLIAKKSSEFEESFFLWNCGFSDQYVVLKGILSQCDAGALLKTSIRSSDGLIGRWPRLLEFTSLSETWNGVRGQSLFLFSRRSILVNTIMVYLCFLVVVRETYWLV